MGTYELQRLTLFGWETIHGPTLYGACATELTKLIRWKRKFRFRIVNVATGEVPYEQSAVGDQPPWWVSG